MKCPQCGHQNAKHYKFCLDCGAEIPSVSVEPSKPKTSSSQRVGFADAFDSAPIKNPSPETLIRQVEDLSSGLGFSSSIDVPITTPPPQELKNQLMGNQLANDPLANDLLSTSQDRQESLLTGPLIVDSQEDKANALNLEEAQSLLKSSPFNLGMRKNENEEINFHTNLSNGRDSLASFEGEFFGQVEKVRAEADLAEQKEQKEPSLDLLPPLPQAEDSDPALSALDSLNSPHSAEVAPQKEAIQEALICSSCQADIPDGFLFCGRCGTKVSEPEASFDPIPIETPAEIVEVAPQNEVVQEEPQEQASQSSVASFRMQLIHIHLDGSEGESIYVHDDGFILGREHEWSVLQSDEYLSEQHAQFQFQEDGQVILKDLGGINGIFLRLTRPVELIPGDFFRAGQQLFAFEQLNTKTSVDNFDTKKLGSPQYEAWGRLVHVITQGEVGRAWLLHNSDILLGRVKGEIVFDQDRFMSGQHCTLSFTDGRVQLEDQGSTNGTFVRIRKQIYLEQDDLILLGQKIFKVRFESLKS